DECLGEAEARDRIVVNRQTGLQALVLGVRVHVREQGYRVHRVADTGLPRAQLGSRIRLHRVLILRSARTSADADVLRGLQEQIRAGLVRELAAQARYDAVRRDLALGQRLQGNEHLAAIALATPGE